MLNILLEFPGIFLLSSDPHVSMIQTIYSTQPIAVVTPFGNSIELRERPFIGLVL